MHPPSSPHSGSDRAETAWRQSKLFEDTERYYNESPGDAPNGSNGDASPEPDPEPDPKPAEQSPFAIDDGHKDNPADPLAAMFGAPEVQPRDADTKPHHSKVASAAPSATAQASAPAGKPSNRRSGLLTLIALVVGLFAISFLVSELTTAASMQGATVGNLIHLRASAPGVVSAVTTDEAAQVEPGQVVVRMDSAGLETQLKRIEEVLDLKRLEAAQVSDAIAEEKQRLELLHEISRRTEAMLDLEIQELAIQLELATKLASELQGSVRRGSAKQFEYLEAESNRLRTAKRHEEKLAELDLQELITSHAAEGRHYHAGVVRSWLDELQLHAAKVATEIGQTEVEAAALRTLVDQGTIATHRAGRVFAVHHHPGSSVQAGDPLLTLETDDRVWIIASFKYAEAEHIAYGDRAEIEFPALNRSISGTVVAIGHNVISAIDAASPFLRLTPEEVLVKIEPDASLDELHSGLSAQVTVRTAGFDPFAWLTSRFDRSISEQTPPPADSFNDDAQSEPSSTPPVPPLAPPPVDDDWNDPGPTRPSQDRLTPMNSPFDFSQR